jgi:hypothetical protein
MARLVVNPDSAEAWEIELRPGTNSLGRSEDNDVQIEHSSVSSSHCQIVVSGSSATVKDLGSTSGTFVEGQLVEEARLRSGQVFCLGDVRVRFEARAPEEPTASPGSRLGARPPGIPRPRHQVQQQQRFATLVCGAFLYPLAKDGAVLLLSGTVFLSVIEAGQYFAWFAATEGRGLGSVVGMALLILLMGFGVGYLTSFLRRVVTSTAMNERKSPDWPDVSDLAGDVLVPLLQLAVTILACLAPAIVVGMFVQAHEARGQTAVLIACGWGVIYFPMAFLAVAMFDSLAALNPLLLLPSMARIPGSYLLTVAIMSAVLAAKWAGDYFLPRVFPVPIVPSVLSTLAGLYLVMVEARVLGLLYRANKDRLGWFGHG